MTIQVSRNLRFALWSRGIPRAEWIDWLAGRTNLGTSFCRDLLTDRLDDAAVSPRQLVELVRAIEPDADPEDFRTHDFVSDPRRNVLAENLSFLFDDLERGGKKKLAELWDIDPTTLSRWLSGRSPPQGPALRQIVSYFRLPPDTDLRSDPVFLSLDPMSVVAKRSWVRDRLDRLSEEELQDLYPALRRMLEDDR